MAKIFTLWSVDGGVGKTTMAVNLAIKTAMMYPDKRVALLDFNLFNPDVDMHLGLNSKDLKHMLDYFLREEINFENIENSMYRYEKMKNLYIMTGLYDINFFDKLQMEHFMLLLEYLKQMGFDYIYIDINSALNIDATFVSVCSCDKLLVIGEPQYTCIRNINRYLDEALMKLGITDDKVEIIINRFNPQLIGKDEISHIFGRDNITYVSASKVVQQGINKSEPFVFGNAKELRKSVDSMEKLIQRIAILEETEEMTEDKGGVTDGND